jgi:hypothetical protein
LMFGSPAAARNVGSQSLWAMISLTWVPGLMTPGQRRRSGTRCPPSHVLLAVKRRAPAVRPRHDLCAVVGAINDDGVVRDAEIVELVEQLADHLAMLHHTVGIQADPGSPFRFFFKCVQTCMRVVLNHTKKGLSSFTALSITFRRLN